MAAVLCRKYSISPRDVYEKGHIAELQQMLVHSGQYIPGVNATFPGDLAGEAKITTSGTLSLSALPGNSEWRTLNQHTAIMLPIPKGKTPQFTFNVKAGQPTVLQVAFHVSQRADHFTPDERLSIKEYALEAGTAVIDVNFSLTRKESGYGFIIFQKNEQVSIEQSDVRITGLRK
ncbi:MAG: hypothetical protein LBL07_15185 [Tannerella sp.]|jgi:hypothetical protein|nr:hypothetical protein [Tannerella sp.]